MENQAGRNNVACFSCHSWKVKCSGGHPCERCRKRNRECSYPVRDRVLTVPESYLRCLEMNVLDRNTAKGRDTDSALGLDMTQNSQARPPNRVQTSPLLDDCSAEYFVQKLKEVALRTPSGRRRGRQDEAAEAPTSLRYTYSRLNSDYIYPRASFKLPPESYAFHLLQIFEEGFCDYHWYLRKRFRSRLALTYADPASQANDRTWMCMISVVLALAESWNHSRSPGSSASPNQRDEQANTPPAHNLLSAREPLPGSELFEQALVLLKMSLEEPVVEYVQALNLIAFYCYSLNRRKTAYFYSGQSIRLAKLLKLDESGSDNAAAFGSSAVVGRLESEHNKRVWWTSYCMDRMISTELGLVSSTDIAPDSPQMPSSHGLDPKDIEEFFNPDLLTAQVQLCSIKSTIVLTVTRHAHTQHVLQPLEVIQPCLDMLRRWRNEVPRYMSFSFEGGIPSAMSNLPFGRVLASLYLRYHQCFILLLRPLFLYALSTNYAERHQNHSSSNDSDLVPATSEYATLAAMKFRCLQAARYNAVILTDLSRMGKIAKFGYWESLHLFSSLAILSFCYEKLKRLWIGHKEPGQGQTF
ncbi:hypothetical protein VTK73DRAFT_7272 [Phialemonium thermophilum]|uniref:Zn(2)-C6 fungal-type domain-containing protein n=1 Tax=Phialemonium thermophilum TaxID=223376 RepID=A0ABR3WFT6_9PEZI